MAPRGRTTVDGLLRLSGLSRLRRLFRAEKVDTLEVLGLLVLGPFDPSYVRILHLPARDFRCLRAQYIRSLSRR